MAVAARKKSTDRTYDVLIVGGGVIGLSLAWELAQHGAQVCVVDRGQLGQEASWAGAGMVPPGPKESHWGLATPGEQLAGLSQRLQHLWHERLLELTGIDNEYRRCGSVQLTFAADPTHDLDDKVRRWTELGIVCRPLDTATLSDIEPSLENRAATFTRAYHLPDEAQIRNPRHLRALVAACHLEGVDLRPEVAVHHFETSESCLLRAVTSDQPIQAEAYCLASGSWSGQLAASLGIELPVKPIRGQIVLLEGAPQVIKRNIYVGHRYLTPRSDGRVLVGSTQEDVGFLKENTKSGVSELLSFAKSIAPETGQFAVESRWAGLRPSTADGMPYLGRLPRFDNCWLATGHFRAGLQLSPATAVVMRAMMLGQASPVDVTALGVERPC